MLNLSKHESRFSIACCNTATGPPKLLEYETMNKTAVKTLSAVILALWFAASCTPVKETARTIGHTTRDVTREIGHGARDVTREIGHGTRDVVTGIGEGTRDAVKSASDGAKKIVKPNSEY